MCRRRIILGVCGASGVILGYYLARAVKEQGIELHLIATDAARRTWELETERSFEELTSLADVNYDPHDMAAAISSGSYRTMGMVVAPCSMKSLAGIVSGYADNLLLRAADVCLKENRRVVLCPREMPLGKVHLRNLNEAVTLGCVIVPPMLSFYSGQTTVEEQIHHIVGKILMQFDLEYREFHPWEGPGAEE
ncbi:MAG: UbiX family flavin prenyltransferase [Lachnospiraceae bacterium]|nr:UbiX family flavin prenyltransferase [Lachnospiraceae bacterium]MCD8249603.1 UbiX family flavin prenyltransferase [Lachnospiraceae bacterium]